MKEHNDSKLYQRGSIWVGFVMVKDEWRGRKFNRQMVQFCLLELRLHHDFVKIFDCIESRYVIRLKRNVKIQICMFWG